VKVDREQAQTDVLGHGRTMAKLKREEVEAAERITDDHVDACDRGKSLGDIFPSIRVRKKNGTYAGGYDFDLHVAYESERLTALHRNTGQNVWLWSLEVEHAHWKRRQVSFPLIFHANTRVPTLSVIQVGYVITRLFGVVNVRLEDIPFEEVSQA